MFRQRDLRDRWRGWQITLAIATHTRLTLQLMDPHTQFVTPFAPSARVVIPRDISRNSRPATSPGRSTRPRLPRADVRSNPPSAPTCIPNKVVTGAATIPPIARVWVERIRTENPRIATRNSHGTGCTLSAAITGYLVRGLSLRDAVAAGLDFVSCALESGRDLQWGAGHGPVDHQFAWRRSNV